MSFSMATTASLLATEPSTSLGGMKQFGLLYIAKHGWIFSNGYCEGGHGLSIGSLGEGGAVANVQNIL